MLWIEPISQFQTSNTFTKYLNFKTNFHKYRDSCIYIGIELDSKYQFDEKPNFFVDEQIEGLSKDIIIIIIQEPLKEKEGFETILYDKRHVVFRFTRESANFVYFTSKIGVSHITRIWSWFGFSIGISTIPFIILVNADQNSY